MGCANQFPEKADKKEGVGTYCPYHICEAHRIALVAGKDNSPQKDM